jgi:hypothetical protein
MTPVTDDQIHARLSRLEASMPPVGLPTPARGRPASRRRVILAGAAGVLVLAFAGGTVAREWVDHGWHDSGLFTPGGALHCTVLRNMVPSEAAPILKSMGYEVTWQLEGFPGTRSYQTDIAPTTGYLDEGISKGHRMVIMVDYEKQLPSRCED